MTNGSGCGSGRPKNIRILRIHTRNTAYKYEDYLRPERPAAMLLYNWVNEPHLTLVPVGQHQQVRTAVLLLHNRSRIMPQIIKNRLQNPPASLTCPNPHQKYAVFAHLRQLNFPAQKCMYGYHFFQCWGFVIFRCGFGFADPGPVFFFSGWQDANKKYVFYSKFLFLITFWMYIYISFHRYKKSKKSCNMIEGSGSEQNND